MGERTGVSIRYTKTKFQHKRNLFTSEGLRQGIRDKREKVGEGEGTKDCLFRKLRPM